jgi:SLT domain-containing protein
MDPMDPVAQIIAGIRYIQSRYGDISKVPGVMSVGSGGPYLPYDQGGWLMPGRTNAVNNTGRPERILGPGESSGVSFTIQPGSVVIQIGAGVNADGFRAVLPEIADELWGLFGKQVMEAAANQ